MTNNILSMQIEDNSEIFWYNIGRDKNERLHKGFCRGKNILLF